MTIKHTESVKNSRLEGLDALRGIAALVVLFYHVGHEFGMPWLFQHGYLAVDLFFLLSGFVMSRTYGARLGTQLSISGFLWIRLRRLWPLAAVGSLIGLLSFSGPMASVPLTFLFIPWLGGGFAFPVNNPVWSLHFELVINAFHRLIERHLFIAIFVSWTGLIAAWWTFGHASVGSDAVSFFFGYFRAGASYSIGVWLYRRFGDSSPLPSSFLILLLPVIAATPGGVGDLLGIALFPLAILAALRFSPRWGPPLGALSFPLYALHLPIFALVKSLGGGWPIAVFLSIGVSLLPQLMPKLRRGLQRTKEPPSGQA